MTTNFQRQGSYREVFQVFLRLGLTSFGGPVAHLGYFREEFVTRRGWLAEQGYADLVALCQFLPGPASSQVGIAIGQYRAGYAGALAAWLGFTLPSALALILLALGVVAAGENLAGDFLRGLKLVAVAVVVQAVWGMGRAFCKDAASFSLMVLASCAMLLLPGAFTQVFVIACAAMAGALLFKPGARQAHEPLAAFVSPRTAAMLLGVFLALLLGLPLAQRVITSDLLDIVDAFYRAGALVFGGGHVVLPLLQAEVVPPGWIGNDSFLAGYGAAQAVPGPLFSFAAYLGAAMEKGGGLAGGLVALTAIFAPAFLLVLGCLPFWERLRGNTTARSALAAVNAAVVGLLLAALYDPLWTSSVHGPLDLGLVLLAFTALAYWKLPPWLVVFVGGVGGLVLLRVG